MPFIPHTPEDIEVMLDTIGVDDVETLFDEIPADLRYSGFEHIPVGLSEMSLTRLARELAEKDKAGLNFIGAGAYEHHIPAAVWQIAGRGEFLTAYTPYQAEASQGTLQLLYEYQTMMANLTAMETSNASLYDGASALAEAVLMAARLNRRNSTGRILLPRSLNPRYRDVVTTIVNQQGLTLIDIPFDNKTGKIDEQALEKAAATPFDAMVIPQPNFFGVLEDVDALTNWTHQHKALAIAVVNPIALALLAPPGQWGDKGVDIACGEGQPLGIPLASGGPYFGFMCCQQSHVRQMPGRIIGRTKDLDGKEGFVLTLQAREQHIRRAKATSNICTNQGLAVTAATIFMTLLGGEGLAQVAGHCHDRLVTLQEKLATLQGVNTSFAAPAFHEIVIQFSQPVAPVLAQLDAMGIQGGFDLRHDYPELGHALLVCVTETKTDADLDRFCQALREVLAVKKSEPKVGVNPMIAEEV